MAAGTFAGLSLRKKYSVVLGDFELHTRKGVINTSLRKFSSKIYLREEADFEPRILDSDPVLLEVYFKTDLSSIATIKLQYLSLFSTVAMFGGFSKGLTLLLFFCVFPIREVKYYRQLINSMFSVCMTP